jgi:hypothetical protein
MAENIDSGASLYYIVQPFCRAESSECLVSWHPPEPRLPLPSPAPYVYCCRGRSHSQDDHWTNNFGAKD